MKVPHSAPHGNWRPLLTGELARRAETAIDRIAAGLPKLPMPRPGSRTPTGAAALGSGQSGQALFWAYLALARDDHQAADFAEACLEAALEEVASAVLPVGLYGGFTGAAWVDQHLGRVFFDSGDGVEDSLEEIDRAVLAALRQEPWRQDYDLIRGLVGLGVYALERLPRPLAAECLERVVHHLAASAVETDAGVTWLTGPELLLPIQRREHPRGHYNAGVAHGVPGAIAVLAAACGAGIAASEAKPLLDGAVRWLLGARLPTNGSGQLASFPTAVVAGAESESEPTRLAWCYGDPGIAACLLAAARAAGDDALEAEAVAIARAVAVRQLEGTGVADPGLCHGSAGLGHLFNRIYQATGEEVFADVARYWFRVTLDWKPPRESATGFVTWVPVSEQDMEWQEIGGFLTGVAGIGLALVAATSPVPPDWDRVLLSAIPPRG